MKTALLLSKTDNLLSGAWIANSSAKKDSASIQTAARQTFVQQTGSVLTEKGEQDAFDNSKC